jgi:HEAT repeat protein
MRGEEVVEVKRLAGELASGDDQRAEQAAHRLAAYGDAALPALRPLLESAQVDGRFWAVRTLALVPGPWAATLRREALRDADREVRLCALRAMCEQPTPQAMADLAGHLEGSDPLAARLAGNALVRLGGEALEPLIAALREGTPQTRIEAARALAELRQPEAIAHLFAALDDHSTIVRHWAEIGLERLGQNYVFFAP